MVEQRSSKPHARVRFLLPLNLLYSTDTIYKTLRNQNKQSVLLVRRSPFTTKNTNTTFPKSKKMRERIFASNSFFAPLNTSRRKALTDEDGKTLTERNRRESGQAARNARPKEKTRKYFINYTHHNPAESLQILRAPKNPKSLSVERKRHFDIQAVKRRKLLGKKRERVYEYLLSRTIRTNRVTFQKGLRLTQEYFLSRQLSPAVGSNNTHSAGPSVWLGSSKPRSNKRLVEPDKRRQAHRAFINRERLRIRKEEDAYLQALLDAKRGAGTGNKGATPGTSTPVPRTPIIRDIRNHRPHWSSAYKHRTWSRKTTQLSDENPKLSKLLRTPRGVSGGYRMLHSSRARDTLRYITRSQARPAPYTPKKYKAIRNKQKSSKLRLLLRISKLSTKHVALSSKLTKRNKLFVSPQTSRRVTELALQSLKYFKPQLHKLRLLLIKDKSDSASQDYWNNALYAAYNRVRPDGLRIARRRLNIALAQHGSPRKLRKRSGSFVHIQPRFSKKLMRKVNKMSTRVLLLLRKSLALGNKFGKLLKKLPLSNLTHYYQTRTKRRRFRSRRRPKQGLQLNLIRVLRTATSTQPTVSRNYTTRSRRTKPLSTRALTVNKTLYGFSFKKWAVSPNYLQHFGNTTGSTLRLTKRFLIPTGLFNLYKPSGTLCCMNLQANYYHAGVWFTSPLDNLLYSTGAWAGSSDSGTRWVDRTSTFDAIVSFHTTSIIKRNLSAQGKTEIAHTHGSLASSYAFSSTNNDSALFNTSTLLESYLLVEFSTNRRLSASSRAIMNLNGVSLTGKNFYSNVFSDGNKVSRFNNTFYPYIPCSRNDNPLGTNYNTHQFRTPGGFAAAYGQLTNRIKSIYRTEDVRFESKFFRRRQQKTTPPHTQCSTGLNLNVSQSTNTLEDSSVFFLKRLSTPQDRFTAVPMFLWKIRKRRRKLLQLKLTSLLNSTRGAQLKTPGNYQLIRLKRSLLHTRTNYFKLYRSLGFFRDQRIGRIQALKLLKESFTLRPSRWTTSLGSFFRAKNLYRSTKRSVNTYAYRLRSFIRIATQKLRRRAMLNASRLKAVRHGNRVGFYSAGTHSDKLHSTKGRLWGGSNPTYRQSGSVWGSPTTYANKQVPILPAAQFLNTAGSGIYPLVSILSAPFMYRVFWTNLPMFKRNTQGALRHSLAQIHRFSRLIDSHTVHRSLTPASHRVSNSNLLPHASFRFVVSKKLINFFATQTIRTNFVPWYYNTLIRFLEEVTGRRSLLQFYPFVHQNLEKEAFVRYRKWLPRMGFYERTLGHRFFLEESLHIMHLSFIFKDALLFGSWLKAMILRISFWKTRSIFRFLKYLMHNYYQYAFPDVGIKGLKIKLKGKISVAGNSRKRTILYRVGRTSHASVNLRIAHQSFLINTFTGVMGFRVWLFY